MHDVLEADEELRIKDVIVVVIPHKTEIVNEATEIEAAESSALEYSTEEVASTCKEEK